MIIKDAMRSLRKDAVKAFFYWLTLVLTTMFIFLFFNIAMSDPSLTPFNNNGNMITNVTVLVIILCSIDILFANDFFVKTKGKELGIRMICGGTFTSAATFLLAQTIFLLILAVPVGIALAYIGIPMADAVIQAANITTYPVTFHTDAILYSTVIIFYVIFWIIMLNLSFAYQNPVGRLMSPSAMVTADDFGDFNIKIPEKAVKIISLCLLVIPLVMVHLQKGTVLIADIVGLLGLNACMAFIIEPWIAERISGDKIDQPTTMTVLGFFRRDLKILKYNIFLFLMAAILLTAMMVSSLDNEIAKVAIFVSYAGMTAMQALALMFRFSSEVSQREKLFQTLNFLGFVKADRKKIICREMRYVYGFILIAAFVYIANTMVVYVGAGDISMTTALIMLGIMIVPLLLCWVINLVMYEKLIAQSSAIARVD